VGITNQRETTLVWDRRTGQPLYNAIVWLDTRTAALCDRMTEQLGSQVRRSWPCSISTAPPDLDDTRSVV
jgi:glycerol kinase